MARLHRFQHPTATYHVTTNGVDDQPIYLDYDDRSIWVITLGNAVTRFGLRVLAWCEMTTHNHILLRAPYCNLDAAMQWINGVYAQGHNKRHGRKGHLYGDRYSSWLIQSENHLLNSARYIALNPTEEGMCERPEDWRWGSYTGTVADARPWPANAGWEILSCFSKDPAVARAAYREFVYERLPLLRAA
jgi:putative transposase